MATLIPDRCTFLQRCYLAVLCLLCWAGLLLPELIAAQTAPPVEEVKFHLQDGYLILVQARVNGFGPYPFLVDTGSSRTVIDPQLAQHVRGPVVGQAHLSMPSGQRRVNLVQLDEIRVGRAIVSDSGAMIDSMKQVKLLIPGVRGILGEDFLSRFDLLIDFEQQTLSFGGTAPTGERCRFFSGGSYKGSLTSNRILVETLLDEKENRIPLTLDTGAKITEIYSSEKKSLAVVSRGEASRGGGVTRRRMTLRIGSTTVKDHEVLQSWRDAAFDSSGLLPAVLFRRIYISHSGGYVVLNPENAAEPVSSESMPSTIGQ